MLKCKDEIIQAQAEELNMLKSLKRPTVVGLSSSTDDEHQ